MTATLRALVNMALETFLPVATETTTSTGSAVDMVAYEGTVAFILASEAGTGTTPTLDVKIQGSADGSTGWTDITGAAFAQVTDAGDVEEMILVDVQPALQFMRAVGTVGGTPSFAYGVVAVCPKKYAP